MKFRMKTLTALVLVFGLSCSVWGPNTASGPVTSSVMPSKSEPVYGPGEIEWVEARFHDYQTGLSASEIRRAAETIVEESTKTDIDRELVMAVIYTESGFNNFAVSPVGAVGLMQLMPATGRVLATELGIEWQGTRTLLDPISNVRMGTLYLAELRAKYGNWNQALAAYNWGPGHIDRRIARGRALPVNYVRKVLASSQSTVVP